MSHSEREHSEGDKTKRFATTVRIGEADKNGLRAMTEEYPLYTESVVIRAALQTFLVFGPQLRSEIILASLNGQNIEELLLRSGHIFK